MIPEEIQRDSTTAVTAPANQPVPPAEAELREMLKRCSAATYAAACAFRRTGEIAHVGPIVRGVIERYVDSDLRAKMQTRDPGLRLCEDLGLDSLSLMEIVLLAEDVLGISISQEELRQLRTLGDVEQFMARKLSAAPATSIAPGPR